MAALTLITPPAAEPVTVADAKLDLRVTLSDDDALISALITAARQYAEKYTRRQLVTATWLYSLDAFRSAIYGPGYDTFRSAATLPQTLGSFPFGSLNYPWNVIDIPLPPLQSISSISYTDTAGTVQTLDPSTYLVDTHTEWGRISPAFGMTWPPTRAVINAVGITFIAGYSTVPAAICQAIKLLVNHWYQHRVAVSDAPYKEVPFAVSALLDSYRFGSYV